MHADVTSFAARVTFPTESCRHFDRDSCRHLRRQNALLISRILLIKDFRRRHADHARINALGLELLVGIDAELELASGSDQNDLRLSARRVGQNVTTLRYTRSRRVFRAIQSRKSLPCKHPRRW